MIAGEFKFSDNKVMVERVGSDEHANEAGETLEFKERIRLKVLKE
jgi:hypothetical protein